MVLCVGGVILGMVIIGFSVSQFVQGAAARAAQIAQKREVDLNDNPWGEAVPPSLPSTVGRARCRSRQAAMALR